MGKLTDALRRKRRVDAEAHERAVRAVLEQALARELAWSGDRLLRAAQKEFKTTGSIAATLQAFVAEPVRERAVLNVAPSLALIGADPVVVLTALHAACVASLRGVGSRGLGMIVTRHWPVLAGRVAGQCMNGGPH